MDVAVNRWTYMTWDALSEQIQYIVQAGLKVPDDDKVESFKKNGFGDL